MKRCDEPARTDYSGIQESLKDVINAQILLGKEVLKLLGGAADGLRGIPLPSLPKMKSCCDVPEPCWMPVALGEVECKLRPGDSGQVCLAITNHDFRAHAYEVVAAGRDAALVTVGAPKFQLGPKETRCVVATLTVPKDPRPRGDESKCCHDIEALVWVRGCRNHYLRWSVDLTDRCEPCCWQIEVDDRADYVLHWYDHFYGFRPCYGPLTTGRQG